ncbi:hypothetical protein A2Y85_04025 [candidate division WOR-3 bacterium RBG_13_43_14]|uniref:Methyl-accepting transducer domain-containing protein n=1 Tax=candidate division WOR-3 bacterium RBG_13_43_14 TaxID=1802590 RepID=A0A1F4UBL7_UNCW3|nr:MAG: hypothetical protein A2Y85_04025 [candidate division WOR-3 bacterium RBG_13_43_14]
MKKYKITIAVIGFILQMVLYVLFAQRLGYWRNIGLSYAAIPLVIMIFLIIYRKEIGLRQYSAIYFFTTLISSLVAGVIAKFGFLAYGWLLVAGVCTGLTVAVLIYHFTHIAIPGGLQNPGFSHFIEVSCTFFAGAAYPLMILVPFTLSYAIFMAIVILAISIVIGFVLTHPFRVALNTIADAVHEWRTIEHLPVIKSSITGRFITVINELLKQVRESFGDLNQMSGEIKGSSEDLSSASEQMNASLQEVSSTIQQISHGAQEQSSSIMSIAKSIEGLNTLTTSISSQVKMASVSSRRTTDTAKQGMELSNQEAHIARELFEQTKFISDKMTELLNQSGEIKKILDITAGITEQTDLLALNAAIEAARVGEKGRGFAVIADEIRNLANEAQQSSAIVESLIAEINKTVQELSNLLSSERDKVNDANVLASQSEEQFTGIVKAVDLVTDMITRINQAAANQSNNTRDLVKQVEQIAQVAADTAAATQEVSASVQEQTASMEEFTSTAQILSQFAMRLQTLISKLRK